MTEPLHRAAVLGDPIEHSLSPVLHTAGYEAAGLDSWAYTRIRCTADELPRIVGTSDASFAGFSVTMPGKFAALDFADESTDRARAIGSANTLTRIDGGWRADNTDCEGITGALGELVGDTPITRAIVVGAGGTARPALWALARAGAKTVTVVNRSDRSAEIAPLLEPHGVEFRFVALNEDVTELAMAADVIVSTVPSAGLDADKIKQLGHAPVLDVIYDPWPTPLATRAASNGYLTVGGLSMLAHQSFSQFEQFTGHPAPRAAMRSALFNHFGLADVQS
ncbi:shikimate dehydrogenase [Corynebacterium aquatimens]|uniref:shikimate dehydrogenase (NADP(+)) n=1 Tax=Corynebacterium aquatimens TaxID=1190508 RepID=A0A931E0V8_9CORY|nr:shikimate dehydrogenase [Corynebacterium aquatimens]MBG6121701.1 shikimate dehydrogenase [Corynebacterium aquatimens]WJY65760.1 Shikimate dehydrogenase [Corynebacterium aquatimens]